MSNVNQLVKCCLVLLDGSNEKLHFSEREHAYIYTVISEYQ